MLTTPSRQILRPAELIPVIGYIRVSTWFEEKISDELQKAAIEEATRRRGRVVVKWIPDLDATGRNFKRRIMEAIEGVEKGTFDGAREIWVWKYSRFGRNRHGVAVNLARIEAAGGQLISATEDVDTSTATGGLTRDMLFAIAQFESNRIGEQWRETHEYRRLQGLPATGGPRFGYTWQAREIVDGALKTPESYEPNPDTLDAVRQAYEDYAHNDATFRSLAEELNNRGLYNPASKAVGWERVTVQSYLDSGFAAGLLHVHRSDIECPRRSACKPAKGHYGFIPGSQPAIISDELWAAYLKRREQRRQLPPATRLPKFPYSGLTKCGICGWAATVSRGRERHGPTRYRCNGRYGRPEVSTCPGSSVAMRAIEAEVLVWLKKASVEVDRRLAGMILMPKQAGPSSDAGRRQRIAAEIAKVQKGLDRASMAHVLGDMPRESYLRVRDDLVAKRERLDADLAALGVEAAPGAAWEARGAVVRRLLEEWDTLSVSAKRDLLMSALERIRIFPPGAGRRVECVPKPGYVF